MADVFLFIAAVLIFFGIMFGVMRLLLGRTVVDRVVAVDMLTIISISMIALYAHISGRFIYLDVALVYGVLSFLSVWRWPAILSGDFESTCLNFWSFCCAAAFLQAVSWRSA